MPGRGRRWTDSERAFVLVTATAFLAFGVYTAVKGAYLSTVFSNVVPERNLIYLTPLVFAGAAWLLERGGQRAWAVAAAGALTVWLLVDTPFSLEYPNYEAHGFAILALANRELRWDGARMEDVLVAIAVVWHGGAAPAAAGASPRLRLGVAGLLAVGVLAWTTTAQVYASSGERDLADRIYSGLPKPADWLDRTAGDGTAVFLGQGLRDNNPLWSLVICSIVLPIAASQGADSNVYQIAPRTKNTIAAIHTARCLAPLIMTLLRHRRREGYLNTGCGSSRDFRGRLAHGADSGEPDRRVVPFAGLHRPFACAADR